MQQMQKMMCKRILWSIPNCTKIPFKIQLSNLLGTLFTANRLAYLYRTVKLKTAAYAAFGKEMPMISGSEIQQYCK